MLLGSIDYCAVNRGELFNGIFIVCFPCIPSVMICGLCNSANLLCFIEKMSHYGGDENYCLNLSIEFYGNVSLGK